MSELKSQSEPKIILSLKQANALYRCLVSEYNDAPLMLKDKEIDKSIKFLENEINKIESVENNNRLRNRKCCWYCHEKGTIKSSICSNCLMVN